MIPRTVSYLSNPGSITTYKVSIIIIPVIAGSRPVAGALKGLLDLRRKIQGLGFRPLVRRAV